jgi:PhzF family phenazine biosynthesis protein
MRIRIVDAFTDRPFAGNPAGVVLLDTGAFPDDTWLQQVAAEVNLSETAFAHPLPEGAGADWALRWLTPATEVSMCGHATLATAHVLRTTGAATGTVRFATLSGVLSATGDPGGTITLDFPTAPLTEITVASAVTDALGATVLSAQDTGPQVGDLLVELADEKAVRALTPDFAALGRLVKRAVIATALPRGPGPRL